VTVNKDDEVWFSQHGFKLRGKVLSVLRSQVVVEVTSVLRAPASSGGWSIEAGEVVAVRFSELDNHKESPTEFQAFVAMLARANIKFTEKVWTTDRADVVHVVGAPVGFLFERESGLLMAIIDAREI